LENGHAFGNVTDVTEITHYRREWTYVYMMENVYLCGETTKVSQLNDKHKISYNEIFEAIFNKESHLTSVLASTVVNQQCSALQ
jgi:hypothetical protein